MLPCVSACLKSRGRIDGHAGTQLGNHALQGLCIREIPPDGNCLFRAVEDQIEQAGPPVSSSGRSHSDLRQRAASHMQQHPDDYLPFVIQVCDSALSEFELLSMSFARACNGVKDLTECRPAWPCFPWQVAMIRTSSGISGDMHTPGTSSFLLPTDSCYVGRNIMQALHREQKSSVTLQARIAA